MPRCHECSKIAFSSWKPYQFDCLRKWPSGPDLIRYANSGCDLCSFIRKEIEKVSIANLRRMDDQPPIVLRDCNEEISLRVNHNALLEIPGRHFTRTVGMKKASCYSAIQALVLETPYDPILHACELLEACMLGDTDKHDHCQPRTEDPTMKAVSLPRRLLDLSHDNIVLTLDTQEWIAENRATVEELSKYCTLSYRWGKRPPACMLSAQLTEDRISFFVSMPQTFQDAIIVARGLGIRFLWIDALCIVQPSAHGDYDDWIKEGPRMWLVYQNSICTIAATCSEEPNDGFLHKVGTDFNPPFSILEGCAEDGTRETTFIFSNIPTGYASVIASNLNRRGWVAQERLLSRRVLHFTEEGIFWECQASDLDGKDGSANAEFMVNELEIGENIGPHHASLMLFEIWLAFIELYSRSEFTLQTDRLIALSSIARCVPTERFGHGYFAGIWGLHLLECLSWSSRSPCPATTRESCLKIAPSWSWASVPGGVLYPTRAFGAHSKTFLDFIHVETSLAEADNEYGNIDEGALKLCGLICKIPLPTEGKYFLDTDKSEFSDVGEVDQELTWDEHQSPSTSMEEYTVMPLGICVLHDLVVFNGLVITLLPSTGDGDTGDPSEVYRRIGHIHCQLNEVRLNRVEHPGGVHSMIPVWTDTLFPNATEQTIVIV